ncbi:MAG: InlB B-repeat-containing protein, partial [Christensenellales bacterium]
WTRTSSYSTNTIVTEDGITCTKATINTPAGEGDLIGQDITGKLKANTEYITGMKLKLSSPNGAILLHIPADKTIDGVSEWGDVMNDGATGLMGNYNKDWVDLCFHKTTKNFTSIAESYFMIYARNGFTGPLYIRNFTFAEATNKDRKISFDSVNYNIEKPTHTGYTFQGYYTQPVGGIKIFNADCSAVKNVSGYTDSNGAWIKADDVKLYAQWSENNYTLTLYENKNLLNGGELSKSSDISVWTRTSNYVSNTIVTEDGRICTKSTLDPSWESADLIGQNITGKLKANTDYIVGVKLKLSSPNGELLLHIPVSGTIDGVSEWGESMLDRYNNLMYNYNKGWVDLCFHKTTKNFTSITEAYFMLYVRNGFTGPLYVRDFTFAEATNITRNITYSSSPGSVSPLTYSGFTFNGYYTQPSGGVKIYNADGSLVKGVAGYTDSSGAWIRAEDTKLYGQWTQN